MGALPWVSFALYFEWGVIHVGAGAASLYFSMAGDICSYLGGICGGAPKTLHEDMKKVTTWPPMNVRILIQHALNLGFVGLYSLALAVWTVTDLNRYSWYLGLYPFLADIAYFLAIDTVHFGEAPGEMQTVIISTAQICTALAVKKRFPITIPELAVQLAVPACLISCAAVNKIIHLSSSKVRRLFEFITCDYFFSQE